MVMADIGQQIREAAIARGIDPEVALRIANAESDLVSSAKNPRSSARGLFQVTDDTWKFYGGDLLYATHDDGNDGQDAVYATEDGMDPFFDEPVHHRVV